MEIEVLLKRKQKHWDKMDAHEELFGFRRRTKRLPCNLRGSITLDNGSLAQVICKDISSKGTGIVSPFPLPINTYLKITVFTSKISKVALEGKICWSKKQTEGWRMGIIFNKELIFDLERFS